MTVKALAAELERAPFKPLRLHLDDGRTITVDNPDIAVIADHAVYLFKVRRQHSRIADDTQVISLLHIVSFDRMGTSGNGKRRRTR